MKRSGATSIPRRKKRPTKRGHSVDTTGTEHKRHASRSYPYGDDSILPQQLEGDVLSLPSFGKANNSVPIHPHFFPSRAVSGQAAPRALTDAPTARQQIFI